MLTFLLLKVNIHLPQFGFKNCIIFDGGGGRSRCRSQWVGQGRIRFLPPVMSAEPLGWSGNERSAEGKEHVRSSPVCMVLGLTKTQTPEAKIMTVALGSRDLLMCPMGGISH